MNIQTSQLSRWGLLVLLTLAILSCQTKATPANRNNLSAQSAVITPTSKVKLPEPFEFPLPKGRQLGNADAIVTVEVFSDFQCPACKIYATTVEPKIIQQYISTGKVEYIYRHYTFIGLESVQAANASMCAAEQNYFWEYHNILFANQGAENQGNFSNQMLIAFAKSAGLDMKIFTDCFAQDHYQADIDQDLALGKSRSVSAVPSVFVNGIAIKPGKMPGVKDLQNAIDTILSQP